MALVLLQVVRDLPSGGAAFGAGHFDPVPLAPRVEGGLAPWGADGCLAEPVRRDALEHRRLAHSAGRINDAALARHVTPDASSQTRWIDGLLMPRAPLGEFVVAVLLPRAQEEMCRIDAAGIVARVANLFVRRDRTAEEEIRRTVSADHPVSVEREAPVASAWIAARAPRLTVSTACPIPATRVLTDFVLALKALYRRVAHNDNLAAIRSLRNVRCYGAVS